MALRVLALETAGDQVRAAVAERAWESFRLLGTFEETRTDDEADLGPALSRLVSDAGKPDIVVSALPGETVAHRVLTLPFKDARKLRQVVPFALEEHLPFPVDDAISVFTKIGQEDDNTAVFAAVVRKADLQQHLDLLGKAGIDPKCVTLGALALARLLARACGGGNGHAAAAHLILSIDHARTSMVLLDAHGAPRAIRTLSAGLENDRLPLPSQTAASIVTAARQTILAHGSDLEPPDLLIAGPAASIPAVRSEIAAGLAAAVRDFSPLDGAGIFDDLQGDWLRFGACVAMLLGEAPSNPIELLNFRQGEFAFRGRSFDAAPLYTSAALAIGVAIFALVHVVLSTGTSVRRLSALNRQIAAIAEPALGSKHVNDVPAALRNGIASMRKQLKLMGGGAAHSTPLDILLSVSKAIPDRLQVDFADVEIDASSIKLDGEADTFGTIDQVKKALAQSGYFSDIAVNDAKVASNTGKVNFHLSAALAESPPEK
jgi:general secretion pathway protein L